MTLIEAIAIKTKNLMQEKIFLNKCWRQKRIYLIIV